MTITQLRERLEALTKEGKISLDVAKELTPALDESVEHISKLEKENKELHDQVVDLVMHNPVSKNPEQPNKEVVPKTLEECLEDAAKSKD